MRPSKLALSALAVAFALSGTAYAAGNTPPVSNPAANSVHAAAPAKHRLLKKKSAKKASAKTSASTTATTHTGAH